MQKYHLKEDIVVLAKAKTQSEHKNNKTDRQNYYDHF